MAIAVEYSRTSGALDGGDVDKALWELGIKRGIAESTEFETLFTQMIDRRLEDSRTDEARWSATPLATLQEDGSSDSRSRHWVRAMLNIRMDDAAAAGDYANFESYSKRFLDIPYVGQDREFWRKYDLTVVASARAKLTAATAGR